MKKDWDYAWLSHLAKMNGGPEELLDKMARHNRHLGRQDMYGAVVIAGVVGMLASAAYNKLINYLDEKNRESEIEYQKARQEIIDGINKYDKEHEE